MGPFPFDKHLGILRICLDSMKVPSVASHNSGVTFVEAIAHRVLIGDGANGTCLAHHGFRQTPYDLANLQAPDLVRQIHGEYLDAGSDFVETNTFMSNRWRLEGREIDIREINLAGARLAREAAGPDRYVLGAIGPIGRAVEPIGHVTREEVATAVLEQAEALKEGGVDGFFLESYVDVDELKIAIETILPLGLPIVASKAFIEDGEALAEGLPDKVAREITGLGVVAFGANCIVGPQRMLDLIRQIAEATEFPPVAFPTPGMPQLVKGEVTYDTSPEYFAKATARLIEEGARLVGGCCGTMPAHIRALKELISSKPPKARERHQTTIAQAQKAPLTQTPPTALLEKVRKGEFVTAVEMDVPRGIVLDKLIAGTRLLQESGVDVVNISDGARARLRMSPAAVCKLLQDGTGAEVVMHFACRDRNLLAVQSDLLGAHAIGIQNILAVTGDPANIGDYPSATSVFDVDSIGLIRIMSRFNEGIDLAGYSVGVRCGYTIACAFNPGANDRELELDRLRRKADAGAHIVYTQPVFDVAAVDWTTEQCRKLGLPCFVGVLPLRSQRHAEFMHNEVPGIDVPEALRERIASAPDDASALEIGIEESRTLAHHVRECAQGLYLMPPAGSARLAVRVLAL